LIRASSPPLPAGPPALSADVQNRPRQFCYPPSYPSGGALGYRNAAMFGQIITIKSQGYPCCCFRPGCYSCWNESATLMSKLPLQFISIENEER